MRLDLIKRRKLSYKLNKWNDVNLPYIVDLQSNLPELVLNFFETQSQLIYPAKSYFVAIVYSFCLSNWFNVPIIEALSDPELLPDDKFFKPYAEDMLTYNKIIDNMPNDILSLDSTQKTIDYFKREFLVGEYEWSL